MTNRRTPLRAVALFAALAVTASACSSGDDTAAPAPTAAPSPTSEILVVPDDARSFPPAPAVPDGPLHPDDQATIETIIGTLDIGFSDSITEFAAQGDARTLWVLADLLRFAQGAGPGQTILATATEMTGVSFDPNRPWSDLTDHLIAWDIPAPPNYEIFKAAVFTTVDDRWNFVFADAEADVDWRLLSWGGVLIDDRPLGDPNPCVRGCIPALDDPALTPADEGDWYPDDEIVFGVRIGDDAVAFPRNIMEIHEMVNITIGGQRLGIPYCTLCGSAQAFITDEVRGVERPPVLRTSGLLSRSNKVMYDLDSQTVFDTFTGAAVAGPLRDAGVVLPQVSVVTTTWADWRATHPDTTIVAEDGGLGRSYPLDPLRGRDDNGPIFPIGQVDDRLGVQTQVLGVTLEDGSTIAVPADAARAELLAGGTVVLGDVEVILDGQGLRANLDGEPIATHQAFWFAWSQFHPDTDLWVPA